MQGSGKGRNPRQKGHDLRNYGGGWKLKCIRYYDVFFLGSGAITGWKFDTGPDDAGRTDQTDTILNDDEFIDTMTFYSRRILLTKSKLNGNSKGEWIVEQNEAD